MSHPVILDEGNEKNNEKFLKDKKENFNAISLTRAGGF